MAKITTLKLYVKAVVMLTLINMTPVAPDPRKRVREKSSIKWLKTMKWRILQIKSSLYHDVHFNSVNTRMHTKLECEMPHGLKTSETFKIDTGANCNLMPITMFAKVFPKISLDTLGKTIEQGVTLYAYNNTPIKEFGIYSVKISFKGKQTICKFHVVEYSTMIIGIADSEKLDLVRVNLM